MIYSNRLRERMDGQTSLTQIPNTKIQFTRKTHEGIVSPSNTILYFVEVFTSKFFALSSTSCVYKLLFDLRIRGQACSVTVGIVTEARSLPCLAPGGTPALPITSYEPLCQVFYFLICIVGIIIICSSLTS